MPPLWTLFLAHPTWLLGRQCCTLHKSLEEILALFGLGNLGREMNSRQGIYDLHRGVEMRKGVLCEVLGIFFKIMVIHHYMCLVLKKMF